MSAPTAVEWLTDASPKLHTAIASAGQAASTPSLRARPMRERHADRARQVRGDGGGLRDDGELAAAEHLVPAAGDRLVGGGGHAEQHVADRVDALDLAAPGARRTPPDR